LVVTERLARKIGKNIAGPRIREARDAHKSSLTQDQLAGRLAALGVTLDRTAIAKIESGHRGIYDFELAALATALGVDANWLIGVARKPKP
jgi:transcriptional regulator with XRE-family HTH domain